MDILEKYIENLVIKKNLLDSSVEAYKLDINEYLSFLENREKDIFNSNEDLFIEYFKEIEDKYSVASFKRKYSTIRNFYKFLLKNRYIDKIFEYKLSVDEKVEVIDALKEGVDKVEGSKEIWEKLDKMLDEM